MSVATKAKAAPQAVASKHVRKHPHAQNGSTAPAKSNGSPLGVWRRQTGLNRQTFARLSHVSERSLATYEKTAQVPDAVRPQVTEARRLVEALQELVPADQLPDWLQSPNPGFGGRTPAQLNDSGERDLLWEMIHQTRHGAFA